MALMTRIARLFRADFHAVLDSIEEPEVMLRQAIREMAEELARREQHARLAGHELQGLQARRQELGQALAGIEEQLDLCLTADKPGLARTLIRRKLENERLEKHIAGRAAELAERLEGERARLEEHRLTLAGFRQKAEILSRRMPPPDPRLCSAAPGETAVTEEEVEVALLAERNRRRPS